MSTITLSESTKVGVSQENHVSKNHLMCLFMSGNLSALETTFPNAQVIHSLDVLKDLDTMHKHPDAVVLYADDIDGFFFKQLSLASELLRDYSIPLLVVSDALDMDTKKLVLKNGADDCFTTEIHAEGFDYWINFLKRFKKFTKERALPKPESFKFKISFSKRAFDIVMSLTALLLLSPIMILIALIVKLESKGPVFYISKRAGSGYKVFDFLKFRTMRVGADAELAKLKHLNEYGDEENGSVFFKIKNDPRITRFGTLLRNTSLDELPQLINVLKGDMSVVGNRPLPLYEAQRLTKDQAAMRFMTAAGITGLWQVTKRGKKELSDDERIALDVQYAKDNSFQKDMMLIAKTFPALSQDISS
jgi:lipopolysaccharide/colanic/teichoic acid biosynthesis glycosyltransferase